MNTENVYITQNKSEKEETEKQIKEIRKIKWETDKMVDLNQNISLVTLNVNGLNIHI